jgi:hypothetical protein
MYSSQLVAIRRGIVERTLAQDLPRGLQEFSVEEVKEFQFRMADLWDRKGAQTRPLSKAEQAFVVNEQILGKIDFKYFSERYTTINIGGQALGKLYPLWETQKLILAEIARVEWANYEQGHPDGIVVNLLKDRQVGGSTLSIAILAHRLLTHANVFGLLASDVPDSSDFLWDMFERIYDHLPWYMKPTAKERVKNDLFLFGTESHLFWGASKSTRGADKSGRNAQDGLKGQLARGKTLSCIHNSELATWTRPEQIDVSLKPAVAVSPLTFWMRESTAQGRGKTNWWWLEWQLAKSGKSRAHNIFIPWYAEASRHWLPAPVGWSPSLTTLAHARRAEEQGPRWLHRPVKLSREQLCWYETTRAEAEAKEQLEEFLQEHPADDDEAFQYATKSVVPVLLRERIKAQARPLKGMIDVKPYREIAHV